MVIHSGTPKGGLRSIIYLYSYHNIYLKSLIHQESNNLCEVMDLKLLLRLAQEFSVAHLQIFGDSILLVIK